ncbi:MAG: chromosome partitioning protein ParA [Eubacteriales bacterium]|nr:chromosome partitioning protein ParA [Eubacteriales bacterium]
MKIKLAILEKDRNYLNRIVTALNTKYSDKFEIYSFTDVEVALSSLDSARIEVFISSDAYEIETTKLPKRCGFAYFVDSSDIETLNDQRAICKFQKIDLIYKQILSIFSENAGNLSGLKIADEECNIVSFISASGGVGSSSAAAACALHFASQGKKVLYLNIEKFGSSDSFFHADGQFDMSDIIFSLKTKKANLSLKLESCVKQDQTGVCFYSQPKIALDMMELGSDEIIRLLSELKLTGSYEYIILDSDFCIDKNNLAVYRQAHDIVLVSDGSEISNQKTFRAYTALTTLEENEDSPITNRISLFYNQFSNKTSKAIDDTIGIKSIGGAPKYEHATTMQVLQQLSAMDAFNKVM